MAATKENEQQKRNHQENFRKIKSKSEKKRKPGSYQWISDRNYSADHSGGIHNSDHK